MKKKILIGSIIAVALLTLVSFSSVVGYNVVKNTQEEIITDEYDSYSPISLVFQLISKLRNNKEIQNVESEDDVLQIIESDAELNGIIEELKSYSCGCEDEDTTDEWNFPVLCWILFGLVIGTLGIEVFIIFQYNGNFENLLLFLVRSIAGIYFVIGSIYNCDWAQE